MGSSPQSPSRTDLESTQKGVAVSYQAGLAGSQDATALLAFPPRKVSGWVLLLLGCTCATPHALPCPPVNGGSFLSWMMGMDSGDGDRQSRLGRPLPWMLSPGGGVSFGGASRVRSWHHRNLKKKPHPSAWTPHKRPPHLPEAGRRGRPCGKELPQHSGNPWKP